MAGIMKHRTFHVTSTARVKGAPSVLQNERQIHKGIELGKQVDETIWADSQIFNDINPNSYNTRQSLNHQ